MKVAVKVRAAPRRMSADPARGLARRGQTSMTPACGDPAAALRPLDARRKRGTFIAVVLLADIRRDFPCAGRRGFR